MTFRYENQGSKASFAHKNARPLTQPRREVSAVNAGVTSISTASINP